MTRCVPCVEKRLRKLVKQRTEELRQAQAENAKWKEATRHFLETISLAQRNVNLELVAERDALEALAALVEGKV